MPTGGEPLVIDTGPLVAAINRRDNHFAACGRPEHVASFTLLP